jgi:hypothetical protein
MLQLSQIFVSWSQNGLQSSFETQGYREKFENRFEPKTESRQICELGFYPKIKAREKLNPVLTQTPEFK